MNREQIKEAILNMYPGIVFENELFLEEIVLKDFSLEDIAYRLSSLLYGDNLWKYLYNYDYNLASDRYPIVREMIKYIVVNNIDYFRMDNEDLFYKMNIFDEYVRLYNKKEFSLDDLDRLNNENMKNNSNKSFFEFDLSYYNEFIVVQKLFREGKIKISDIDEFVKFNTELLKNILVNELGNYDACYDRYINEIISYFVMGNISVSSLFIAVNSPNSVKNLLYIAKFGVVGDNLDNISFEVISSLSGKKVKKIYKIVESKINIDNYFEKDEFMAILINMCSLLSEEVVDNIVRHLPSDINAVQSLFFCFKDINLDCVLVENNKIKHKEEFIKYFVGDSFNEPTSLLNLIYSGDFKLGSNIESLYNNWESLSIEFEKQKLLTRTSFFEQTFDGSRVLLDPDEYRLKGDIVNSYYANRKHQKLTPSSAVNNLRKIYKEMRHKYQKTIPYVKGEYKDYTYEILKANDPDLFKMGNDCDCCFKIGGDASSFVSYCAKDKNARVLCVKDQDSQVIAMVPMVRNGNLVLCNSVESRYRKDFNLIKDMFSILEKVGEDIIDISFEKEGIDNMIGAVLISNYINDIRTFGKYKPVLSGEIPVECICLLKKGIYSNIDVNYCGNYYISCDKRKNRKDFRRFDPTFLYDDPRDEVIELESEFIDSNVIDVINSIYYEKNGSVLNFDNVEKVIFNEDWFIFIDKNHKIISCIVSDDLRAKMEYYEYLSLEKEYCSYYDFEGNIKVDARYR